MKKILLIILALSPFICLIGLGAGAISAYETAEKAALSILIKNKKDPAGRKQRSCVRKQRSCLRIKIIRTLYLQYIC